jgi:hypothetical protein
MTAELHSHRCPRTYMSGLRCEPLLRVLLEGDAARGRVDVLATRHVGFDLCEPFLCEPLLPVGKGLALLRAIGADVAGAVAHTRAVAVGLDAVGLAVRSCLGPEPAVLDVAGHEAAVPLLGVRRAVVLRSGQAASAAIRSAIQWWTAAGS